jgi:hypothetical protein
MRNQNSLDLCVSAEPRVSALLTRSTQLYAMRSLVNELNESGAFIQKFQRNYNPAGVACEAVAAGRSRSTIYMHHAR